MSAALFVKNFIAPPNGLSRKAGLLLLLLSLLAGCTANEKPQGFQLNSPDNSIQVAIEKKGGLHYTVTRNGANIIQPSALNLVLFDTLQLAEFDITSSETKTVNQHWVNKFGKNQEIDDHYTELTLSLASSGKQVTAQVQFRCYDDAIAFRYLVPTQKGIDSVLINKDGTQFNLTGAKSTACWYGKMEKIGKQECRYPQVNADTLAAIDFVAAPVLIKSEKQALAVTEAALNNWPGAYYNIRKDSSDVIRVTTTNLEIKKGVIVQSALPVASPWRTVLLANQPGDFLVSNVIDNLNEPSVIQDESWIQPGLCAWDNWWSRGVKIDKATMMKYIDFAAEMGYPYQLIDWQWYGAWDSPKADVRVPAKELDLPYLLAYAKKKNVRLWLWAFYKDLDPHMEEALKLYHEWGIAGIKIDGVHRTPNDQHLTNYYRRLCQLTADNHLLLNIHGAYQPTGLSRTYPNLLTREAVLGNEYNRETRLATPKHNVTIPFTRMILGAMDYTPGGFLNRSPKAFKVTSPTQVPGTRCHQLAMFVVYESPLTTVCDHPDTYHAYPDGLDFLKTVPTTWTKTTFLAGEVGEYIVVARQKEQSFYVGGMTDKARTIKLNCGFLPKNKQYEAELLLDTKDHQYMKLQKKVIPLTSTEEVAIQMDEAGGFVMVIKEKAK